MALLERPTGETFHKRSIGVLETARLVLRAPRIEDVKAIASLANDRRVAEMTARMPHPYREADAEQFVARANASDIETAFAIALSDGTLIGGCGFGKFRGDAPEIGYWLGVSYWGRGYATEAARALIDHAFTDHGYEKLVAGARVNNPASRRVLEKCGFQWTGVELRRVRAIASSAPVDRFRLDLGLWKSLRSWGDRTA